jgi:hypothetical protein
LESAARDLKPDAHDDVRRQLCTIEIESVDGTTLRPTESIGGAIWREPGEIHDLRNVGRSTYRNILVEIKRAS